jgi:hypothetical protein
MGCSVGVSVETLNSTGIKESMSATYLKQSIYRPDGQLSHMGLVQPVAGAVVHSGHLVASGPTEDFLTVLPHYGSRCPDLGSCLSQPYLDVLAFGQLIAVSGRHTMTHPILEVIYGTLGHAQDG